MAKHALTYDPQAAARRPSYAEGPKHRGPEKFVPVTDVWTTPEDIRVQRHEFDLAQQKLVTAP